MRAVEFEELVAKIGDEKVREALKLSEAGEVVPEMLNASVGLDLAARVRKD